VGEAADALLLGVLADGEEVVPGLGLLPALLLEELAGVPQAPDGVDVVEGDDLALLETRRGCPG